MEDDEDPDDPVRQDEVARRLMAYAAKLRTDREEDGDGKSDSN